jgi:hypothetical protein
MNLRLYLAGIFFACLGLPVSACRPRADPPFRLSAIDSLARFERIYIGTIVAVRLTYLIENLEQQQLNQNEQEEFSETTIIGGSTPFEVEVFPREALRGEASTKHTFSAGGCDVTEPNVRNDVIVFVKADGATSFYNLSHDKPVASAYLAQVRKCLAGSCGLQQSD